MAGKYQIVTEVVTTDGSDVPAPTFTVVNYKPDIDYSFHEKQVQIY